MSRSVGPALRIVEGLVCRDEFEKHDPIVLVCDATDPSVPTVNGVAQMYPRYLIDDFVGRRVRITIEAIEEPCDHVKPLLYQLPEGASLAWCWFCGAHRLDFKRKRGDWLLPRRR